MFWTKHKPTVPMARPRNCRPPRAALWLEELERRDAPATLVDPMTLTYQDVAREQVRVHISRPLFQAATINNVFTFASGSVHGDNTIAQQLKTIDLTQLAAQGVSLSITTNRPGGNGHADLGFINAAGIDLGTVTVDGDLGRIDVGHLTGLHALTAESLGRHLLAAGGNVSHIQGSLGLLQVGSDVAGASILVADAPGGAAGTIGLVRVGGSLLGGAGDASGVIASTGNMDWVIIGNDVRGGAGADSGVVRSDARIGIVFLGRSLIGGLGGHSGQIRTGPTSVGGGGLPGGPASPATVHALSDCGLGPVMIVGDVRGGAGVQSGAIVNNTLGPVERVTVQQSLIGGAGFESGEIFSGGDLGAVMIGGDVRGGHGSGSQDAGGIVSLGSIASVHVEGSLLGGDEAGSGQISASNSPIFGASPTAVPGGLGPVTIEHDVRGGAGFQSGSIQAAGLFASVKVGGSLIGGMGDDSGQICQQNAGLGSKLGPVEIDGDVKGGAGLQSGAVLAADKIDRITVEGSLLGGDGESSGQITVGPSTFASPAVPLLVGDAVSDSGSLGPVTIEVNVRGGRGFQSGAIVSSGAIASVYLGGSLVGGAGEFSGQIHGDAAIGPVTVKADVVGGTGNRSGIIFCGVTVDSVTIAGSLIGGAGEASGRVDSGGRLGAVTIQHDLRGGAGADSGVVASGFLIAEATVGGSLLGGRGDGSGQIAAQGSGRLGTVKIKHDVRGGAGVQSGAILGATELRVLTVDGSIRSGAGAASGSIMAGHLGAITVQGSIVGSATNPVLISAPGGARAETQTISKMVPVTMEVTVSFRVPLVGCRFVVVVEKKTITAFRTVEETRTIKIQNAAKLDSLTVGGRVEYANIVAGFRGQIGVIHVTGNWIASSVAAGIYPGPDGYFGTADDVVIHAAPGLIVTINQIVIEGQALGTPAAVNANDHYGFAAQEVKSLTVHGFTVAVTPGPGNDDLLVGTTGDLRLREVTP